ncbi:MAG: hypothetical protein JWQ63_2811 [Mucilaginibacter sp.]|nr:hypothetical protein [Mucilaginibacter sp.]
MSEKSEAGAIFLNHHKEISFPFFNYSIPGAGVLKKNILHPAQAPKEN